MANELDKGIVIPPVSQEIKDGSAKVRLKRILAGKLETATDEEAIAGTDTEKFMTPAATNAAIENVTELESGTDLNNIKESGTYFAIGDRVASMQNAPTEVAFFLDVKVFMNVVIQIATEYGGNSNLDPKIYIRGFYQSTTSPATWTPWILQASGFGGITLNNNLNGQISYKTITNSADLNTMPQGMCIFSGTAGASDPDTILRSTDFQGLSFVQSGQCTQILLAGNRIYFRVQDSPSDLSNVTYGDWNEFMSSVDGRITVTASTQSAINASGITVVTGVTANTYTLKNLLQQLVNKSHTHGTRGYNYCSYCTYCKYCSYCNCNCSDSDGTCIVSGTVICSYGDSLVEKSISNLLIGDWVLCSDGNFREVVDIVERSIGKRELATLSVNGVLQGIVTTDHPLLSDVGTVVLNKSKFFFENKIAYETISKKRAGYFLNEVSVVEVSDSYQTPLQERVEVSLFSSHKISKCYLPVLKEGGAIQIGRVPVIVGKMLC